ncbi:putative transcription elongation factor spt5 like protein 1 [Quercus suber]|uniref:Transcription elongation factor spt5 like protein 1 n=1 Tax=Quercus suber TaxID=58331 RepID=A0AAW0M4F6_QUESU
MVKCAIGHEQEVVVCLMQKGIDKGSELNIRSAIALDHLKGYVYVEADKEAHVKEACKGLRNIFASQKGMPKLVPIKEMTDVLTVENKAKAMDLCWVRIKNGTYKGDLAKVVNVDNVRQRVTVKLIPRIDLQALAVGNKSVSKGRGVVVPPPRFMNIDEARELNITVKRGRDPMTGDYFDKIDAMMFKDGFLYKKVSMKSISSQNIKPTLDEVEKFGDIEANLSTLFANRKKGHFVKGDAVIVVKGDLKNLKGWVEKVEEDNVHIRPDMKGLPKTISVNEKELCKCFEPGNHVKVVSGTVEGTTESTEACRVLMGVPDIHGQVSLVKLREIKFKIDKKISVQDQNQNTVATKDVVKIVSGPCKGKQGPVQHIYGGVLFIYDRHHLEHAGFICAKANCCVIAGGSRANGARNYGAPPRSNPQLSNRFSRGHDDLVGKRVMIRQPLYKGCHGIVKEVTGSLVRVELESQTKVVTVDRKFISEKRNVVDYNSTPYRGSETPMHPSRTPMRDNIPGTTPIHDGMRTPMRDRAWNPYTPMRDQAWNPYTPSTPQYQPGITPQYQPGSPSHTYDSSSSPYVNAPSPYLPSTPNSASYLPSTPETGGLDTMSPVIGGDNEGPYFMPDIVVNVRRLGEKESAVGIVREVLMDGSCRIVLSENGETMTALPDEMGVVAPRKNDKVKIMAGVHRGTTGKLIGVDGSDGIVKVDDSRDVKIIELILLAKLT